MTEHDDYRTPRPASGQWAAPDRRQGPEPAPSTQEISAAQVRAESVPTPQGAAAAAKPPQIPLAPIKRVQARFNPLADGMMYLVVFLGGMLGTAMRYALSFALPATAAPDGFWSSFHVPTFTANMVACFVFACLASYLSQAAWIRKRTRQLTSRGIGMGMCGGFSTLSALAIEELVSLQADRIAAAVTYLLISFACGLLVAYLGARLGLLAASRKTAKAAENALLQRAKGGERHVTAGQTVVIAPDAADAAGAGAGAGVPPSYEPAPITDEIPLTGDPTTGEAR